MTVREWKMGDRVVHAGKPEWGIAEVRTAESVVQDGSRCQRLTLRFERAGIKTISTAFAELRTPEDAAHLDQPLSTDEPTWLDEAEKGALHERIAQLPDPATDPFASKRNRLKATLLLYRFTNSGSSLLDWAATQTGMKDPLSRFSRHDLEQFFERFVMNRDAHLKKLVHELKREDPGAISDLISTAPPAGQQALRRFDATR